MIMPLKIKIHDGMIESDSAFGLPLLLRNISQNIKYARHSVPFTDK